MAQRLSLGPVTMNAIGSNIRFALVVVGLVVLRAHLLAAWPIASTERVSIIL